ncbi:hypothetical protein HDU67_002855 [Dinochytrium kinnereticum]|nr:hypothetical protein HDU67_002855 [Dinochytrium kinnereticum]
MEQTINAVTSKLQENLKADTIQMRIDNELYLRSHPEIKHILDYTLRQVLEHQPDDVEEFTAAIFADPNLSAKVKEHSAAMQGYTAAYVESLH